MTLKSSISIVSPLRYLITLSSETGRLDKDTEGLLIITNDGAMAHDLLSPKKHVDKTYYSKVKGKIEDTAVKQFANGLFVDDELTALPAGLLSIKYSYS